MPTPLFVRVLVLGLSLAFGAAHSGCSREAESEQPLPPTRMSGAYVNETGVLRFYFSDDRVRMAGGIADFDTTYDVEGDTLWITTADGGRKAMTIGADGWLTGELGVFTKKK
jgi:hypothetical protein